jgi:hypothetical protein
MNLPPGIVSGAGGLRFLAVFFVSQMVGKLAVNDRFDDFLNDLPHKGVKINQGFDALLLEHSFQIVSVKSQWNLLVSFYLSKEVYTVFLTLPVGRMCVFPAELAYSEGHLTVLDHGHHVVHCREIVERIPAHDDDVGKLARLQRTDTVTEPTDDGRVPCGRL